jgi:uncharacterized protein (TIGR02301 family)
MALHGSANAQDAEATKVLTEEEKREAALKAREEAEIRVETDMMEMTSLVEALSKNLGQLHYLRTLCFGDEDQKWRDYARKMMNIESKSSTENKSRLVRAFNAGYYQEKTRHTECNKSVSVDVAALAENGRHISSMLADPYRDF